MKKNYLFFVLAICFSSATSSVFATDLLEAYNDALKSDPTYLAAKSTYEASLQDVPITRSVLLPQLFLQNTNNGSAFISKARHSGSASSNDTLSSRGYGMQLSLTQSIFDFTAIEEFRAAKDTVKAAAETYYAALQTLMVTVATNYFTVLNNQENLRYAEANVQANKSSLTQAQQQYRVGTNTLTDVYTAQAAYSSAVSTQVTAKNNLENSIETLRSVTGKLYTEFSPLRDDLPLVSPDPKNVDEWVKVALQNNPTIKSANYTAMAAMKIVGAQQGGHLPTVDLNASYGEAYQYDISDDASNTGSGRTTGGSIGVNVSLPIFEGGLVTAQTRQAESNYETAIHNLELQHRSVETSTRQNYLSVLSAITAVEADKTSVKSNESALRGLEAGYRVGTQTMIDVLNQQSLLLSAEQTYAADRFHYVTSLINLKNDTGVLSLYDLEAVNEWLKKADVDATNNDIQKRQGLNILDSRDR